MRLSRRWRNLGIASGAVTAVLFAAYDLYQWAEAYAGDRFHNDFTFYYVAARIGLAHGWPHIYDLGLQQAELDAIGSGIKIAQLARYISPPPVAWSALPLSALPFPVAYWIWAGLLLAALVLTWHLAAPGHGPVRFIHLAAAIGWLPVIYALQLGQPGLFVALGVAACYALLLGNRPLLAGVVLGALALKPQIAFLVPVALLLGGRLRAFWGSAISLGLLLLISAIAIGPSGISAYAARLGFAAGVPVNQELTLAPLVGNLDLTRAIQVVIAAWSLGLAYRLRKRGLEWVLVPALVGGQLASPYLHLDDLVMLGLAGWLCLRASPPAAAGLLMFAMVVATEGIPIWGPLPVVVGELLSLVLLSLASPKTVEPAHDSAGLDRGAGPAFNPQPP